MEALLKRISLPQHFHLLEQETTGVIINSLLKELAYQLAFEGPWSADREAGKETSEQLICEKRV